MLSGRRSVLLAASMLTSRFDCKLAARGILGNQGCCHSADETEWAIPVDYNEDVSMERVDGSLDGALRNDAFWTFGQGVKPKLAGLRICVERLLDVAVSCSEASAPMLSARSCLIGGRSGMPRGGVRHMRATIPVAIRRGPSPL